MQSPFKRIFPGKTLFSWCLCLFGRTFVSKENDWKSQSEVSQGTWRLSCWETSLQRPDPAKLFKNARRMKNRNVLWANDLAHAHKMLEMSPELCEWKRFRMDFQTKVQFAASETRKYKGWGWLVCCNSRSSNQQLALSLQPLRIRNIFFIVGAQSDFSSILTPEQSISFLGSPTTPWSLHSRRAKAQAVIANYCGASADALALTFDEQADSSCSWPLFKNLKFWQYIFCFEATMFFRMQLFNDVHLKLDRFGDGPSKVI